MIKRGTVQFYGFNPPFIGGQQKVMSRQEDDRLLKNDILQLLLTIPGERVMRPGFGVNLRNFVFENIDSASLSALKNEIITQLRTYETRVDLVSVDIIPNEAENSINIKIAVTLKSDPMRLIKIEQFFKGTQ